MKTPDDYSINTAYSYSDSKELADYYDDSAGGYDEYAESVGYVLPHIVAKKAAQLIHGDELIIDIGCGTGILGAELDSIKNGLHIHGLDMSSKMIVQAYMKKRHDGNRCYKLFHYLDLASGDIVPENQYIFMVSSGTFTTGHLDGVHFSKMVSSMKDESIAVFSVKSDHFDKSRFMDELVNLENRRLVKVLEITEVDSYKNAEYSAMSKIVSLKITKN
jgi:predicted TPR repeat methyltransferase